MTIRCSTQQPLSPSEHALYGKFIGIVRCIAATIGSEIAYTTSALAAYRKDPFHLHQKDPHRLLRYLASNRNISITFTEDSRYLSATFTVYVDGNWAGCRTSRRRGTGSAIQYSDFCNDWRSKLQATVSGSFSEAEHASVEQQRSASNGFGPWPRYGTMPFTPSQHPFARR